MICRKLALAIVLLAALSATCSCAKESASTRQGNKNNGVKSFDDRSTEVNIINWIARPYSDMVLVGYGIDSGEWRTYPPSSAIGYNSAAKMVTESTVWATGAGGWVKYKVKNDGTILTYKWFNPYAGPNSYEASADVDDYYFTQAGGDGDNTNIKWYVRRKDLPTPITNYSVVIMADPQPWRLGSGGDPNSEDENGSKWRTINQNTSHSILTHDNVKFHIVNGDLSEFGRQAQYDDYYAIYRTSGVFVTEGLGNHDYHNNVGDCIAFETGDFISKDGCAVSAVIRQYKAIQHIKDNVHQIAGSAFSSDITHHVMGGVTVLETYKGSLAYSWDVGDIHYIQLQNYPTYTVNLTASMLAIANITDSLDWLAADLEKASLRGKASIINFHDAKPAGSSESHFLDKSNLPQLIKFKEIITAHDVKAIFVGHTHQQAYCRAKADTVFGNIPIYTAGAMFNGDYYLVDVQGKNISVKAYNGKTRQPVLVKDLGTVGGDTNFSSTCSNL